MARQAGNDVPNLRTGFVVDDHGALEWHANNLVPAALLNKLLRDHFGRAWQRPFMLSTHHIPDREENAHWQPERFLGEGGFGRVGLWVKRDDATFAAVDHMAIKQGQRRMNLEWKDERGDRVRGLASEAVLQHMMNHQDLRSRDNVLRLRQYKYFAQPQQWRLFLEYASHGDAGLLLDRYKIWNQHLPELFLWHVFHSLALVVEDMAYGRRPWRDFNDERDSVTLAHYHMTHFDLKPSNIFFGGVVNPTVADPTSNYPIVKVADFGLAELEDYGVVRQFYRYEHIGTQGFLPPEQRMYGKEWTRPPNVYDYDADGDIAGNVEVTIKHNVYAMGHIMHDLLKLADEDDLENEQPDETDFWDPHSYDQNICLPIKIDPDATPVYSPELTDLIRQCLRPKVADRPSPETVVALTNTGLTKAKNHGWDDEEDPVFFTVAEMHDMVEGDANIPATDHEWNRLMAGGYRQLDEPMLRPPNVNKWLAHYTANPPKRDDLDWVPNDQQPHLHIVNNQIQFQGLPQQPQPLAAAPQPNPPQQQPAPPPIVALTAATFNNTALDHRNGLKPAAVQAKIRADALRLYNITKTITRQRAEFYIVLAARHGKMVDRQRRSGAADWVNFIWGIPDALNVEPHHDASMTTKMTNVMARRPTATTRQVYYSLRFNARAADPEATVLQELRYMYGP